ncbi:hypothetical protein ACJMK2_038119 [Sinanodonta woodiana]|uniref:Uncharacterized protein n=1 Tax=Sinanodonta woodiana TaxID=1069815 RepID=A0ABD3WMI9_SINWO
MESKMVWVKDVTTSLQTDKRAFSDTDLPDDLTFQLRGGSRSLTLNLKRNHAIDPNTNVYFVNKLNDGRSQMKKALIVDEEDVAYYQDKTNGAFLTVKCLRKLSGGCDRVINGNILIKQRNYDLHPTKTGITSRELFDVPDLGTRYVLRPQTIIPRESPVSREDSTTNNEKQDDERFAFVFRKGSSLHTRGNVKRVYYVETAVLLDSSIWDL